MSSFPCPLLVIVLASAALCAGCSQAPAPSPTPNKQATPAATPFVPSATYQELMDSVIDPAADQIWNAVSIRTDATGTYETKPTTADDWHQLRRAAMVLVESANLMAVPGRTVAKGATTMEGENLDVPAIQQRLTTRHEEMVNFAVAMRDVGGKLVSAADGQDLDALMELGATLNTVCEACHRVFWYPEQPAMDASN